MAAALDFGGGAGGGTNVGAQAQAQTQVRAREREREKKARPAAQLRGAAPPARPPARHSRAEPPPAVCGSAPARPEARVLRRREGTGALPAPPLASKGAADFDGLVAWRTFQGFGLGPRASPIGRATEIIEPSGATALKLVTGSAKPPRLKVKEANTRRASSRPPSARSSRRAPTDTRAGTGYAGVAFSRAGAARRGARSPRAAPLPLRQARFFAQCCGTCVSDFSAAALAHNRWPCARPMCTRAGGRWHVR